MKTIRLYLLVSIILFIGCSGEEENSQDLLIQTGLIGKWELKDEIMNGNISDMLPRCCQFFEFNTDENKKDFKGFFIYTDEVNTEYTGVYIVDLNNQIIQFEDLNSDQTIYGFTISSSQLNLTLTYTDGNIEYTQSWSRVD